MQEKTVDFTLKLVELPTRCSWTDFKRIIKGKREREQSVVTLTLQQKAANQRTIKSSTRREGGKGQNITVIHKQRL